MTRWTGWCRHQKKFRWTGCKIYEIWLSRAPSFGMFIYWFYMLWLRFACLYCYLACVFDFHFLSSVSLVLRSVNLSQACFFFNRCTDLIEIVVGYWWWEELNWVQLFCIPSFERKHLKRLMMYEVYHFPIAI